MKSYLDLIGISEKVNRKTTLLVRLCIAMSVFLVTSIFGLVEMAIRVEAGRIARKHGFSTIASLINNPGVQLYMIVAFVLFFLVLVAGVLMISSSINSNVAQRVKFYGLMRCIGMSKKQVKKFVRREALSWCKLSIPLGNVLGIFATWILCLVMKYGIGGEFADIPVSRISLIAVVLGAAVGLISVLLAARTPAKKASSVNPIIAVTDQDANVNSSLFDTKHMGIDKALGVNHALSSKKNLFLLVSSFALSIILFLTFSTLVQFVNYIMPQLSNKEDIRISANEGEIIDGELPGVLNDIEGVERAYGRKNAFDVPVVVNGQDEYIDVVSYSDFDLDCLTKDRLLKTHLNVNEIKGNNYAAISTWDRTTDYKVGDEIRIDDTTVTVQGLLKQDIFSANGMTDGKRTLIISNNSFQEIFGESGYSAVLVQLTDGVSEDSVQDIFAAIPDNYIAEDQREYDTASTYWMFLFFVYSFIAIIAMVAMLNIINAISISVSSQYKRYGMMRGIGMELKQVKNVIIGEACVYSILGTLFGCVIGIGASKMIFDKLIGSHFEYATWEISPSNIVLILIFVIISTFIAVESSFKRIETMDIVSQIS